MPRKIKELAIEEVSLVDTGANQLAHIKLWKRNSAGDPAQKVEPMTDQEKAALEKQVADAKTALDAANKELADLKGSGTLTTDLEGAKKNFAKVESALVAEREQLRKELEARTAELEATKQETVKLNKQRRREKFIKLAQTLSHLPGTQADDFGEMLDEINHALPEKRFTKLYTLFQSWDTIVEKNNLLMQEIGRDGGDLGMLSGPEAQIEALAREKVTHEPKLSLAKARTMVIEENPALYRKYQREQGRK